MKLSLLSPLRRLVLLVFVCTAAVGAAEKPGAGTPVQEPNDRVIAQVDFKAVKVQDVVDFLREKTNVNIIVGRGAGEIVVPELKLRNVRVSELLHAINVATGGALSVGTASESLLTIETAVPLAQPAAKPAIVSRAFLLPAGSDQDFDKQLENTLGAVKSAINLYIEAQDQGTTLQMPKLEAHRPTHLLLVAGPRWSVDIVGQVISALRGETISASPEEAPASSLKVTILGQVKKPGVYMLDAGSSLAPLVAQAEGFTSIANKKRINVVSKDGSKKAIDFSKDPVSYPLQDGDVVTVPESIY